MANRYCFFNVDGLLNKKSDWKKPFTLNYGLANFFCFFLAEHDLIPVLTSSWRLGFNGAGDKDNAPYIKELEAIFDSYGLKISDKTPYLKGRPRDKEIERFLYFHRGKDYIVIDGNPDEYERINDRVYFINPNEGFTEADAKKADKLLAKAAASFRSSSFGLPL
ncbi:MAG: hypothetical protein IK111_03410 [Lachnospiraceae bacterium]|nr:hypothetical protein [Lachnospiraceae bacterium]